MTIPTLLPPDSELLDLQTRFTRHLRNPESEPVPAGLDERRMSVYRELIFHNVSSLMSEFFPVVHQLLQEAAWQQLIRDFFVHHRAETPYFPRLAEEFLHFLMGRPGDNETPAYLLPLAHYEWLELYLYIHEAELPTSPLNREMLASEPLYLAELAVPASYTYPVHHIKPGWHEVGQATYLLVFRDKHDNVRFFELQPLAFELLNAMQSSEQGLELEPWIIDQAQAYQQDKDTFFKFALDLLEQFNEENLIYVKANELAAGPTGAPV